MFFFPLFWRGKWQKCLYTFCPLDLTHPSFFLKQTASHMKRFYLYTYVGFPFSILPLFPIPLNLNSHSEDCLVATGWGSMVARTPYPWLCIQKHMHDQGHQCGIWWSIWNIVVWIVFFLGWWRALSSKNNKTAHLQAVLGGTVSVPTLTGNVTVKVCIHSYEVWHYSCRMIANHCRIPLVGVLSFVILFV